MTLAAAIPFLSNKSARGLARAWIVLLMLSHALFAFSSATSLSHDPLGDLTHAHALADGYAGQADHGHSHDDLEDGGSHQHGHNPSDHSHDKPNVPPSHVMSHPPLSNQWIADELLGDYPAPYASLERPPKRPPIV